VVSFDIFACGVLVTETSRHFRNLAVNRAMLFRQWIPGVCNGQLQLMQALVPDSRDLGFVRFA